MDFARRIGKSEEQRKIWKKTRQPLVTTRDDILSEDAPFVEDRRFVNWRKWLADRKRQNRRIEVLTGRPQVDQLQSSSERFRAFVEMKNLMEHAAIPVPVIADKYRGGPEFWRMPEFLPDHDTCHLPKIALTPTRKDLNLPPDLMHVELPDLIAKERDLIALKTKEEFWKRSEYLKTRKLELAEEIALLWPKEPKTAELVVKGRAFRKKQPLLRIPPITVTEPDDEEESNRKDADQMVVLKIQDREFIWQGSPFEPMDIDPIMWSLTFTSEIDELVEKEIILENKGTRVIVYHWRELPTFRSINVSFERRGSPFFFNKTKGLILPGQIVKIKIWYRARTRAVFTESWRFITEPRLSSATFVFRFWGCAIDNRCTELTDHRMIDAHLDLRIRDSTIRSIIEEIMTRVKTSKPSEPAYEPLLSQGDVFTSLNPYYYYYPSIVMQLQKMYYDVTDESSSPWNLSLNTLRDILLQIEDANYKCDMLARFNELCKQSLRRNLTEFDVARKNKYDAVYNILCAFANCFEDESELVKKNSLIRKESAMKIDQQESTLSSQRSNKSFKEIHREKSIDQTVVQEGKESHCLNLQLYREIFFIRMYKTLEEAIERVCASIDSFNRLHEFKRKI